MKHVAVIDIGKTNAKLVLVDLADMSELAVVTRPNRVLPGPPWPHFDLDGHWEFILESLSRFQSDHGIDAISVTTHGASVVLLDEFGNLAAPMLDYEHPGPDAFAVSYDAIRPDFSETGSPRLSMGLNVGAQLHYMFETVPGLRERTGYILTYPQYWSYRLTGVPATEVSSLGCHSDLWDPFNARLSSLVERLGITGKIAPQHPARDVLGTVLREVADKTNIRSGTPVLCGIHDSNASLLPYVLDRNPPFSVVSTGTWVIAMSMGSKKVELDPNRDTLVNVNALGAAVPSARFMGGREHDIISDGQTGEPNGADLDAVLSERVMLMPAVVADTGPFQGRSSTWIGAEPETGSGKRAAVLAFYLALMTAESLRLAGHSGEILVEGPFAQNQAYLDMLSAATNSIVRRSGGTTGTSLGSALLALSDGAFKLPEMETVDCRSDRRLNAYAEDWRGRVQD